MIKELTGDWVNPIECDAIQHPDRLFFDEVVYFGAPEDMEEGGVMEFLETASIHDRYTFYNEPIGIFIN